MGGMVIIWGGLMGVDGIVRRTRRVMVWVRSIGCICQSPQRNKDTLMYWGDMEKGLITFVSLGWLLVVVFTVVGILYG